MRCAILQAAILACVAVEATTAQRRPLAGRVIDAAGAPVAGASVTLVWSPPGGPECGTSDVVTATADARGRFVARLFPQESYSAYAIATAADGSARASPIREGVAAGGDVELRIGGPAERRRVRLVGADAWAAIGPLHVEVALRAANVAAFPLDAEGATPPLPPGSAGLALVRDAAGAVLCARQLQPGDGPADVVLPPPRRWRLRVVDAAGAPVAGATVHHATAPSNVPLLDTDAPFERPRVQWWRHAGTTAADGTATIDALSEAALGHWPLLVRAPGMAESVVLTMPSRPDSPVDVNGRPAARADDAFVVPMRRAARLRLLQRGTPVAGAEAFLTAFATSPLMQRAAPLRFDASGTWTCRSRWRSSRRCCTCAPRPARPGT
jgi:hypothetical protein